MPYKISNQGGVDFSGAVSSWVQDFQRWHQEDTRNDRSIEFFQYVTIMTGAYAQLAFAQWQASDKTRSKSERLASFSSQQEGKIHVNVFSMLDFLAENLTDSIRIKWSNQCRSQAKQMLNTK